MLDKCAHTISAKNGGNGSRDGARIGRGVVEMVQRGMEMAQGTTFRATLQFYDVVRPVVTNS